MTNFSVATNFDPELLTEIEKLNGEYPGKIIEVYGSLPYSIVGSGRSRAGLPDITSENLAQHITKAHDHGLKFSYLLNANAGVRLNDAVYKKSAIEEIKSLLNAGIDSLTIADDSLIDLVRSCYPDTEVHLSVIKGVSETQEVKKYADKRIKVITLNQHTVNRKFQRIEDIVKSAPEIEFRLYANISCLQGCPERDGHYRYLSSQSQSQSQSQNTPFSTKPDSYVVKCALEYLENPIEFLRSPFIRPEDIATYESLGIKAFKLSDRREPTTALIDLFQAYLEGEFNGNLFALLFRDGRKWTNSFSAARLEYPSPPNIFIDNKFLSHIGFLDRIKALNGEDLEKFYKKVTPFAVRGIDSKQTKIFKRWLSELLSDI